MKPRVAARRPGVVENGMNASVPARKPLYTSARPSMMALNVSLGRIAFAVFTGSGS